MVRWAYILLWLKLQSLLKRINKNLPIFKVQHSVAQTAILQINDDKTIGINTQPDPTVSIIIDSKNKGNSGVRLSNHNQALLTPNLMDLAVDNGGIVVARGKDIGATFFCF